VQDNVPVARKMNERISYLTKLMEQYAGTPAADAYAQEITFLQNKMVEMGLAGVITLDDGTKVVVGSQVGLSERQLLEQDLGRAVLRIESDVNKVALTAEQAITLLGTGGSSVNSKVSALGTYLQGLVGTTGSATGQLATMISELNTAKAALEAASKDVSSITSLLSNLSSA